MNKSAGRLSRQHGIGFVPLMLIFAMCGAIGLLGLKVIPAYLEYMSVKKVISTMATGEEVKSGTVADIRKSFDRRASIDNINVIKGEDLEITKEGGETVVAAVWQQKVALFTGFTLLIDFSASTTDK